MKKLPGLRRLKTKNLILITFIAVIFLFSGSIHAQEGAEIPGPEIKNASFIGVQNLQAGDWVFVKGEEGNLIPEQITKLDYHREEVEVYNLSVDGEETFFANDFAVHNKAGQDTEKPQCRVIINPTTTNVSSLVKNRSFERPTYRRGAGRGNCPNNWYNAYHADGYWWCDFGLTVAQGRPAGCGSACGSQLVVLGQPHVQARQEVSGLESFNSQPGKVLYKISAWGRVNGAKIYFKEPVGGRWGTYAELCPGCSNWGGPGSLLGWTNAGTQPITLMGETEFDLVSLEKLVGTTTVDSLDINLYVAYYDNRVVYQLRHWNEGEPRPDWTSGDPRVIPFGPNVTTRADPIPHTLGGYGSQTVNVQVMDMSGNVSDICQATVNAEVPTGEIRGRIYKDEEGGCSLTGVVDNWSQISITCTNNTTGVTTPGTMPGTRWFRCCRDAGCTDFQMDRGPTYRIDVYMDKNLGWKKTGCTVDWSEREGSANRRWRTTVSHDLDITWTKKLYLWQGAEAWFQTKEGDVHAEGTINSPIFPTDTYFSLADAGEQPGLVSYNDSAPDFGNGSVSEKGWLAKDGLSRYNYSYFERILDYEPGSFDSFGGLEPGENGVYHSSNPQTISETWNVRSGEWYIILIDNDLTIDHRIDVNPGGFLAFIVSGNITVSDPVGITCGSSSTNGIQGIFITDQTFTTGTGTTESQLRAEGIFVAHDFALNRTCGDDDDTYPGELFIARPDLFINIPDELKTSYFFEQEVAP